MAELTGAMPWEGSLAEGKERVEPLDFTAFFAASFQEILGIVAVAAGRQALAEDATQEAFARALQRWESVSQMKRPDSWVVRVALNVVTDTHRRHRREIELDQELESAPNDAVQEMWVKWNLDRLTPMQRVAMMRRYVDGMPVEEVARTVGRSTDTIKTHLRLGRSRLRALLLEDR